MPGSADPPRNDSAGGPRGSSDAPLRVALTLPGGISPGTFEGGAVAALLAWVQEVNLQQPGTVILDVIAGASAGALTGLLAARVLLAGDDPVSTFHEAWVAAPSLRALRANGPWAPMSLRQARVVAEARLFAPVGDALRQQRDAVTLDVALSCLRGLAQRVPLRPADGLAHEREQPSDRALLVTSYLDWSTHTLTGPAGSRSERQPWVEAMDTALASASYPLAFPARLLNRTFLRSQYATRGIVNLPADDVKLPADERDLRADEQDLPADKQKLELWYTDGGLMDNEPLGRCLARVGECHEPGRRVVILVRSNVRSPPKPDDPAWTVAGRPRWTQTIARVLDLVPGHAADQDLLRVEKINDRLRSTHAVAARIAELLNDDSETRDAFRQLLAGSAQQPGATAPPPAHGPDSPGAGSLPEIIELVLQAASGLAGKRQVQVAVFSSDGRFAGPRSMDGLVGFIQRRQRENHFAAGYRGLLEWIEHAPEVAGCVDPSLVGKAARAVRDRVREPHGALDRSGKTSVRIDAELIALACRTARILRADLHAFRNRRRSLPPGARQRSRRRR